MHGVASLDGGFAILADSMSRTLVVGFHAIPESTRLGKRDPAAQEESCDLRISEAPWWPPTTI